MNVMRLTDAVHLVPATGDPAGQVLDAIHRGVAAVCGRPVTSDAAVANEIRDASILAGVPVRAALPFLFHPQHSYALDLVRDGEIGRLREVRVEASTAVLPDAAAADEDRDDSWFAASFVVAALRSILGADPHRVIGWSETNDAGHDTGFVGTFVYADVVAAVAWSSRPGFGAGYTLVGTDGTIEVPNAFLAAGDELHAQPVVILRRADGARAARGFPMVDTRTAMLDALAGAPSSVDDIVATADTFDMVRIATGRPRTLAQRGQQWNLSPSA